MITKLSVSPNQVIPSSEVDISALVTNVGGREGDYDVVCKINGIEEAKTIVTLPADESQTVTFTIIKDSEGVYNIDINGQTSQFTVVIPQPEFLKPEAVVPSQIQINWWLVAAIIVGCVVIIGAPVYFLLIRKKIFN
jgi:hypothetical protein